MAVAIDPCKIEAGSCIKMPEQEQYPHIIDCYQQHTPDMQEMPLVFKNSIATTIVYSAQDAEAAIKRLSDEYPNSYCVSRPIDWE